MQKSYLIATCVLATFFLTGCFHSKKADIVQPTIVTGDMQTGAVVNTGVMQTGVVETGVVSTGSQAGSGASVGLVNQLKENDKNFDPKTAEDEEIDDLIKFIEKTVNE